jgi:hypothetical protein
MHLNYVGYAGGVTRFRNLVINDGKQGHIATFKGSTGRLGIGTDSPSAKLDVGIGTLGNNGYGGIRIADDATHFWMLIRKNSVGATRLSLYHGQGSVPLVFQEGGGNVGIGTTSPANKLNVNGDIGYTGVIGQGSIYGNTANSSYANMQLYNPATGYSTFNNQTYGYYFNTAGGTKVTILNNGSVGIGVTNPSTKLTVKDSQDSSLYSGLKVERSANTTGAYLNAVGGALNLNTDSSMPLKFRIQNSSMQTINTDGGRAYAANASGLNMKEYGYNFTAANGVTVDLIENTNAHSDIAMVQISITAYHSSRTFFAGMGTFGGYGFHLTGAGNGLGNGGLTSTSTGAGTRKLQWSNTSGYNAVVRLYIQIRTESGITVLNGTLSSL